MHNRKKVAVTLNPVSVEHLRHPFVSLQSLFLLSFPDSGLFQFAELPGPNWWEPEDSCDRRQQITSDFPHSAFLVH